MDEKIINEAMENRFDGIESCVIVEELLELETKNERLKDVLFFITNDVFPRILTKTEQALKEKNGQ